MLDSTIDESEVIQPLIAKYMRNKDMFDKLSEVLFNTIQESNELKPLIHSVKYRSKDPQHLEDKLLRKLRFAREEGRLFEISEENLFSEINDLAAVRILHLHTSQISKIDPLLRQCLASKSFSKRQGPTAKIWDDEYKAFFQQLGIETEQSKNQYTSVHYVFDAQNDLGTTVEVQVRTLAEELWGEVDHMLNYPHKHEALACKEQIAVLARLTSGCTRLVDAIFRTHEDYQKTLAKVKKHKSSPKSKKG